jgi:hypothetical protein
MAGGEMALADIETPRYLVLFEAHFWIRKDRFQYLAAVQAVADGLKALAPPVVEAAEIICARSDQAVILA